MSERPSRPDSIVGPAGQLLTIETLPSPETNRWVISRKAEVVAAVRCGLISLEEACDRYTLSVDEFLSWQRLLERHGLSGLRTTRTKEYRRNASSLGSALSMLDGLDETEPEG